MAGPLQGSTCMLWADCISTLHVRHSNRPASRHLDAHPRMLSQLKIELLASAGRRNTRPETKRRAADGISNDGVILPTHVTQKWSNVTYHIYPRSTPRVGRRDRACLSLIEPSSDATISLIGFIDIHLDLVLVHWIDVRIWMQGSKCRKADYQPLQAV